MLKLALSLCSRCRQTLSQTHYTDRRLGQLYTRRLRSGKSASKHRRQGNPRPSVGWTSPIKSRFPIPDAREYLQSNVAFWAKKPAVRRRLENFGIPDHHTVPLLKEFVKEVQSGKLSSDDAFTKYQLSRFSDIFPSGRAAEYPDRIFTNIFYTWASDPKMQPSLEKLASLDTMLAIQRLYAAADLSYPAETFNYARTLRRKVIMHVGPTNSGKTHNALRALAGAKIGVYAGPLRLLAHEIWERLNEGQIVPRGVDPEPDPASTNMDVADESKTAAPTVKTRGNPKYARSCNLVTGEEQKIVDERATLLSCTVEMISHVAEFDVAVIDEIQMIADPLRGGAWTNAFLGLCAKEIHLCGEETAVPLIEKLIQDTGDEFVVHRYQRLTPLIVEETSLEGDLSRVRKGDCIVTFSRTNIFGLKRQVEKLTGLRCAVAYGRLPPEIRSEQAALFNDPNSGYDVMVGSDAIGMGLNLKIKRIIFEAVRKYDGRVERLLSISQIKQIAGRAGRYGLHGDNSIGGFVTTLHFPDIPVLRKALAAPAQPLQYAYISSSGENIVAISQALPPQAATSTIYGVHTFVSRMRNTYRFVEYSRLETMTEFIDTHGGDLTLEDRNLLMTAPIPWQDDICLETISKFMRMYSTMRVILAESLEGTQYVTRVVEVEKMIAAGKPPKSNQETLSILESFHKVLVLYMWLGFRNPVTFGDHVKAAELKGRVEAALDWCLQGVSAKRDMEKRSIPQLRKPEISWTSARDLQAKRDIGRSHSGQKITR